MLNRRLLRSHTASPEELFKAYQALEIDKEQRTVRLSKPRVITYKGQDEEKVVLVPPGTATLFFANVDSPLLNEVVDTFSDIDPSRISNLAERIINDATKRKPLPLDRAI